MKQLQAHKWSDTFLEYYGRSNKSLNIEEYEFCLNEWESVHTSKMIRYYIYTIVLFGCGLWAVYEQIWFMAVLLLALAHNYNRQSSHHILMSEIMNSHKLLARLINNKNQNQKLSQQD